MDFEKAVMNAVTLLLKFIICRCFFHLSQNFFRKVLERNLIDYATDNEFRLYYKLMQALAFVPENDVGEAIFSS